MDAFIDTLSTCIIIAMCFSLIYYNIFEDYEKFTRNGIIVIIMLLVRIYAKLV